MASTTMPLKHWLMRKLVTSKDNPPPEVVSGPGALQEIGAVAKRLGVSKPLIVTDEVLVRIGLIKRCTDALDAAGVGYAIYDQVVPNPHVQLVEDGYSIFKSEGCDGLIAVGGGSPMDCAKTIGAKVLSGKSVEDMVGLFQIAGMGKGKHHLFPPFVCVPTTAGTGSEATSGAIISFPEKKLKLLVGDSVLLPKVAILDPEVTATLPAHITAATGMDALTHAVEAYLSYWDNPNSRLWALRAVERIGKHLLTCYHSPNDLEAREQMLIASFEAGNAINKVQVGYVHAVAHTLGGLYHVPHGVANAMVMPHLLDFYIQDAGCASKMCDLAVAIGVVGQYDPAPETPAEKTALAKVFIAKVRAMNKEMKLPTSVTKMSESDCEAIAIRALVEAHGSSWFNLFDFGYPVPVYMKHADALKVVRACLPPTTSRL